MARIRPAGVARGGGIPPFRWYRPSTRRRRSDVKLTRVAVAPIEATWFLALVVTGTRTSPANSLLAAGGCHSGSNRCLRLSTEAKRPARRRRGTQQPERSRGRWSRTALLRPLPAARHRCRLARRHLHDVRNSVCSAARQPGEDPFAHIAPTSLPLTAAGRGRFARIEPLVLDGRA